jgi:hypothetical protein
VLVKVEERGEKKGAGDISDAFYRCGGQQGKERGVQGGVRVEERDGWSEGAQVRRSTAGTGP